MLRICFQTASSPTSQPQGLNRRIWLETLPVEQQSDCLILIIELLRYFAQAPTESFPLQQPEVLLRLYPAESEVEGVNWNASNICDIVK